MLWDLKNNQTNFVWKATAIKDCQILPTSLVSSNENI